MCLSNETLASDFYTTKTINHTGIGAGPLVTEKAGHRIDSESY